MKGSDDGLQEPVSLGSWSLSNQIIIKHNVSEIRSLLHLKTETDPVLGTFSSYLQYRIVEKFHTSSDSEEFSVTE